jgi:ribose 5-phosphate isomerase B
MGARRWNDANVLVMSLRATPEAVAREICDAWLEAVPDEAERATIGKSRRSRTRRAAFRRAADGDNAR